MGKGTIALDIDGTIIDPRAETAVCDEVAMFLKALYEAGWSLIFITGREFTYAMLALSKLEFPFYLSVQNGADLIKMPERKHINSVYFDKNLVSAVEELFAKTQSDFLLYSGYESGDFCYYRPHRHPDKIKKSLELMQKRSSTPWKAVRDFNIKKQTRFPMIKAIGSREEFEWMEPVLLKDHLVQWVVIRDPKIDDRNYLLITDGQASKKEALKYMLERKLLQGPLIVAGDDLNDWDSLELADVSVVMEDAPVSLHHLADVMAPSAKSKGIIYGLGIAIQKAHDKEVVKQWE